jgi:hypothetical protein
VRSREGSKVWGINRVVAGDDLGAPGKRISDVLIRVVGLGWNVAAHIA